MVEPPLLPRRAGDVQHKDGKELAVRPNRRGQICDLLGQLEADQRAQPAQTFRAGTRGEDAEQDQLRSAFETKTDDDRQADRGLERAEEEEGVRIQLLRPVRQLRSIQCNDS